MLEEPEFRMLRVPALQDGFRRRGIEWHHLPIPDLQAPGHEFQLRWVAAAADTIGTLRGGGKVLVHCRGGLGRAGTVACMLLMELGATAPDALRAVRRARPGAVETPAQERFVATYKARLPKEADGLV